jgi:8-oxo-dGTP pyrophosphatase MutT (NUDIX family)
MTKKRLLLRGDTAAYSRCLSAIDGQSSKELYGPCAGMIENEDADTAARREAYEELGVDLPTGRLNRTPVALPRTLSLR